MFERKIIILKYLQNFSAKSDFGVHHIFFNINRCKAFLTCNTGNCMLRFTACAFYNPCAQIIRLICVADIDRNALFTYRENSIFMQYRCAHVRKLTQFLICNCFNRFRILDNSRICHKETGNICPVLIYIRMDSLCHDRACDIRTASGESCHHTIILSPIETRHNGIFNIFQS